jgi:gas vesicle protein
MKRAMNFLFGFSIGGVIGATIALLLTPISGEELRTQIQARTQAIQQDVQAAASARRTELEEQLAALRKPQPPQS